MSDEAVSLARPRPAAALSDYFRAACRRLSGLTSVVHESSAAAGAAYDRMMNLIFIGIFLSLCGLEAVERGYLGGSVLWTLHSASGRVNATFLALFAVHWMRACSRSERGLLLAAAAAIGLVFGALPEGQFASAWSLAGLTLAHASIATNLVFILRDRAASPERLRAMRDAWFVPLVVLLSTPMIALTAHFAPLYDGNIYRFEEMLGIRTESVVHALVMAIPFGHSAMEWIYQATAALFVLPLLTAKPRPTALPAAMVGVGLLGYGFYMMLPAVGSYLPDYYRSLWPAGGPAPAVFADLAVFDGIPRNTVPSIHAACAYLFLFNAWRFAPALRRALIAIGILTLVSAIEIGVHWSIDLLVALPFTVATMALLDPDPAVAARFRAPPIAFGYVLTALWVAALHENWLADTNSAVLGWSAVAFTIAASLWILRRFAAAAGRSQAAANRSACDREQNVRARSALSQAVRGAGGESGATRALPAVRRHG